MESIRPVKVVYPFINYTRADNLQTVKYILLHSRLSQLPNKKLDQNRFIRSYNAIRVHRHINLIPCLRRTFKFKN